MAITENSAISLKVSTVVSVLAAVAIMVAGGTFALTRASIGDHIEALKERLYAHSSDAQLPLPDISSKPELKALAKRIATLEKERGVLVQELVLRSNRTLEPGSELAGLILQISSNSSRQRMNAAEGLFLLNDSMAIPTLVAYLNSNRAEALNVRFMFEWYEMLLRNDPEAAIVVGINELTSGVPEMAEGAFKVLRKHIWSNIPSIESRQRIESIALTSNDALARTRAKILIQRLEDSADFIAEMEAEKTLREEEGKRIENSRGDRKINRSIRDILLGIESRLRIEVSE